MCTAVTAADLMALGQTPRKLLDGAWIDLGEFVRTQMTAWLEGQGVPTRQAVAAAQLASEQVVCDVDRWTRDNLHVKVRPGADLLHIPSGMISDHVTARQLASAVR